MVFFLGRALALATCCAAAATALGVVRSSGAELSDEMPAASGSSDWPHIHHWRGKEAAKESWEHRGVSLAADTQSSKLLESFKVLATMLPKGPTKELFSRLKVCAACAELRLLGATTNGGYLTCMDGLGAHARAAYTMGVEPLDRWSKDFFSAFATPVHQFDCTMEGPAANCKDCHFHKVCMSGAGGGGAHPVGPNMNLQQILNITGQAAAPDDSLLMKVSLEGAEWMIFADEKNDLRQFKQLVFQFHKLQKFMYHGTYSRALRNIEDAGFKVASIRGNPDHGTYTVGGIAVPEVVEVTFVKNNPSLEACGA